MKIFLKANNFINHLWGVWIYIKYRLFICTNILLASRVIDTEKDESKSLTINSFLILSYICG